MAWKLPYTQHSNPESAYLKVKESITPETIERFNVKAAMDYNDQEHLIEVKGKGFDLTMDFLDSEVELDLNLSLLLKPLRGKVESILNKQLVKVL